MRLIKLRDTRGNESFALRIEMPTKDYTPRPIDTKSNKRVNRNEHE